MYVELNDIILVGLGVRVDMDKLREASGSGETIKMSISSSLLFPEDDRVECVVTAESDPASESLRLRCSYRGSFTLVTEEPLPESDRVKVSAACTAKMFPYIRELLADVTRRLPISAPVILHPSMGEERALMRQMADSTVDALRGRPAPKPEGQPQ